MNAEMLISIALGIGLAASAGFRVFLPLFALSLFAYFGLWPLSSGWQWLASPAALVILGVATFAEIGAYLIPWLDNALDSIAIPLAGAAGTVAVVSTQADLNPAITWALAIIGGGGVAAAIKTGMGSTRLASTATTGGLANPVVSIAETGAGLVVTLLSLLVPITAIFILFIIAVWLWRKWQRKPQIS
ncbi:DUF4126 domain-containing protein [Stenoxybacter acetivorans]|uniref:DUF4126 domain-containing protein n=1 Tax=Stenoxybacter acetivorans TaxID=422441 RepID=UPI0005644D44|nr:DUF4126 domain-containing protein [Stenoxybacter acetivorans]